MAKSAQSAQSAQPAQSAAHRLLKDPNGHVPYKHDEAVRAGISRDVADLCARLVAAQEARLRDPSEPNVQAENDLMREAQQATQQRRERQLPERNKSVATPKTVNGQVN